MKPKEGFKPRHSLLRALEGWYDIEGVKIKFSCAYHDILRCSTFNGKDHHFHSCYGPKGVYSGTPEVLCRAPWVALIYVPDKHGNFKARCFVELTWRWYFIPEIVLHRPYGNGMPHYKKIMKALRAKTRLVRYRSSPYDISAYRAYR